MMIENGGIIFSITEKTVEASQGGLVHVVFCENGPDTTRLLFTGIQMVVNFRLFHNGVHIVIGGAIVNQSNGFYTSLSLSKTSLISPSMHNNIPTKS
jgi:DNA-directed RNA polymerase II subunit RPB1